MKVLTEMELRAKWKTPEDGVYHVEAGTRLSAGKGGVHGH